ncbi:GLPGLI family protein [Flavobacterium sp. LS1R49]|uniref:GLPGLI family protein n=2 Tax=Flavobacterium shii TaxID=2987687 RepID=A0A9X3C4Z5_9FLAO|nr:GLPGLI family protein [Flavobacterium shii]
MNKIFFTLIVMLGFYQAQAQKDFQGMAIYESKTKAPKFNGMPGNRDITPEMQKDMEEHMKKMLEKTFILNFDQSASIYKEQEKLDMGGSQNGGFRMADPMMGGGGTFYKNVKTKSYTVDKEFMGKEFLVVDSLPKLKWKLEKETKKIGSYICYKATMVKMVMEPDFKNPRPGNDNGEKDEVKKTGDINKVAKGINFTESFDIPKEIIVVAWYTPDIPINQGPENYWGLPGLILEINDGRTIVLCSKIVLNAKDKVTIKAPTNGKVTSQKAYDEIVVKKMKELREMHPNRGRANAGSATLMVR